MRYEVIRDSTTGHCCFEATVVDTENVTYLDRVTPRYAAVCECMDVSDAERICTLLNEADARSRSFSPE